MIRRAGPKLTVAVCTWNRARLLDQTLEQMRALQEPAGGWELIVVNNNCTDDTDEVIAKYASELPLRRLFEPVPGQTNARNSAFASAAGELIVWTDDDVLVDREWLVAYAEAATRYSDASFFGGPIHPWFEVEPPGWLVEVFPRVEAAFATRDFGGQVFELSESKTPFGANYAVRTKVQRCYPYDPEVGLRPGSTMRGDEVSVLRRLLAAGHRGCWVPTAQVRHYIPRERLSRRYLAGFYRGQGEFAARQTPLGGGSRFFGRPRWLWRKALLCECRYRWSQVSASPQIWVERMIEANQCWGQLKASGHAAADRSEEGALAVSPGTLSGPLAGDNVSR
ncbi:glycosyltransferase [Candidatus Laterigemmans baculatus]|uniref:glycosyltransferase n=1 Tax=Candidatus Laterigemmans baculatus TaxID=2770505 RepID=UPI0013DB5726|nr:glycosyltransferase [Candidatus Laterigemmans baculatus]